MPSNKRHLATVFGTFLTSFFFFSPVVAQAKEVTGAANSTMTVELQKVTAAASGKTAQTGDVLVWLILAVIVLAFGFAYIAIKTQSLAGNTGSELELREQKSARCKAVVAGIASLLLAGSCMSVFATKSFADETQIDSKVNVNSYVLVDDQGKVVSSEITAISERANEATVVEVEAPAGFDGWTASLEGQTIQPNSALKGEWQGNKIPDNVLKKLKEGNGKVEIEYSTEVSFDVTYDLSEVEIVAYTEDQVYSATQKTPKVEIEGLDEGEDFEVEYGENVNAGEDAGTITVKGTGFWDSEQTLTFDILKKPITVDWSDLTFTYDKASHKPTATAKDLCAGDSVAVTVSGEQTNAGTYEAEATINDTNYEFAAAQKTSFTIGKKPITATVTATASDKVYNANATATITKAEASFASLATGDTITLKPTYTASFADKNVGANKLVTLSGIEFEGSTLSNYDITSVVQAECKAQITAKEVTVSGLSVNERVYADGDKSGTLQGTAVFASGDIYSGDKVTIGTVSGTYADANAADAKDFSLTIPLTGADAGNYSVSAASKTIKGNILSIVKFVPNANVTSAIAEKNVHYNSTITDDASGKLVARTGATFDGWYNNASCSGTKWDFATSKVAGNVVTLYANWVVNVNESAYWMAPAMGKSNYVSETTNVLKTASEIKADVAKLKAGNVAVIAEYEGYMNNNSYHLYTKWNGSGNTGKNAYVEFQIVSVGTHYNIDGDTSSADGSCISFMASYLLPDTYQMRASDSHADGGWPSSATTLRTSMNSGDIFNGFSTGFTGDIQATKKRSQTTLNTAASTNWTITEDKFWLVSFNEYTGRSADNCSGEGLVYSNLPGAVMKTRDGNAKDWWLRTIHPGYNAWCVTYTSAFVGGYRTSNSSFGVAPCFSF